MVVLKIGVTFPNWMSYFNYFFKGEAGVGWEMKVSKFGQVLPFPNGWDISIIEEKLSNKYFHRFF